MLMFKSLRIVILETAQKVIHDQKCVLYPRYARNASEKNPRYAR